MGTYLKDVATSLAGRTMFIESADGSFKCMSLVGVVSYDPVLVLWRLSLNRRSKIISMI